MLLELQHKEWFIKKWAITTIALQDFGRAKEVLSHSALVIIVYMVFIHVFVMFVFTVAYESIAHILCNKYDLGNYSNNGSCLFITYCLS